MKKNSIRNSLAFAAMVYTTIGIVACHAQAELDLIELSNKRDWVVLNELKAAPPDEVVENKCIKVPHKIGGSVEQDKFLTYAYNLDDCKRGFVKMLVAENGSINLRTQSKFVKNGIREDSWGLCQLHRQWHSDIVDDPRFFTDWKWHIDKCFEKYKGGTVFYGAFKPERADMQLTWNNK